MIGIIKGMAVTLKHQFTRAVTLQYPKERAEIPSRSRGWLVLDQDKCTGCALCAKACPINIISVIMGVREDGKRFVEHWEARTDRCMFCGICSEACPRGILIMVPRYELATTDRSEIRNVQIDVVETPEGMPGCPFAEENLEAAGE